MSPKDSATTTTADVVGVLTPREPPPAAAPAQTQAQGVAMDAYAALDVSKGGQLDAELQSGLEREHAEGGRIELTDQLRAVPSGLTPQMLGWYQAHVAPVRTAALQELKTAFQGDTLSKTAVGRGMLVPAEMAANDHDKVLGYHAVHTDFRRQEMGRIEARDTAAAEYQQARAYQNNRDAVVTPWWYGVGLAVIVAMEMAVNFESVMQLPMVSSPFFATGLAILIGLAVGFAAHVHGTVLKQWHYWFNSFERTRIWQASRKLAIGGMLLAVSLGMIGWARYFYVQPLIQEALINGLEPPNVAFSIIFMTLSNVIVYGVGVIWAYFNHDADYDYPGKKIALDKAERELAAVTGLINRRLKDIDDKHAMRRKQLETFDQQQRSGPRYAESSKALARFCAADKQIEAAMQRYKAALVERLRGQGHQAEFVQPTVTRDDAALEERMTAERFLGRPVELKLLLQG